MVPVGAAVVAPSFPVLPVLGSGFSVGVASPPSPLGPGEVVVPGSARGRCSVRPQLVRGSRFSRPRP